ncbi:molybdopterin dinucleotide binding domain-containing protein [Nonomuraea ferruginea]
MRVESPRGALEARARVCGTRRGTVFVPFHYGYWDRDESGPGDGAARAANELTMTSWDPVSKQPIFKVAAVRLSKVATAEGAVSAAPTVGNRPSRPARPGHRRRARRRGGRARRGGVSHASRPLPGAAAPFADRAGVRLP